MKKNDSMPMVLVLLLILAIPPILLFAADLKVSDMADIHDPHRNDRIYIVDDPNGTPASRAICL